jgi:hypothetical protein
MAVFDPLWRSVWWPWLLVWGITLVLLVINVAIAVTHWRRHPWPPHPRHHDISFYLDDKSVMDLYRLYGGKYMEPLSQEVQEHLIKTREIEMNADLAPLQARAKAGVNREIFRSYIEKAEPITVIGIIIDVLEQADDIVHVDLRKQEVTFNRALDKALGADDDERPTTARLRSLDTFVSIRGQFRATESTADETTFEAPYGDQTSSPPGSPQAYLTCTCETSGMRGPTFPSGSFPARCLGRVENWDPNTSRLKMHPIAIFR